MRESREKDTLKGTKCVCSRNENLLGRKVRKWKDKERKKCRERERNMERKKIERGREEEIERKRKEYRKRKRVLFIPIQSVTNSSFVSSFRVTTNYTQLLAPSTSLSLSFFFSLSSYSASCPLLLFPLSTYFSLTFLSLS